MAKKEPPYWPRWFYGPNKGDEKVCNSSQEVPFGWLPKKPAMWNPPPPPPVIDEEAVIAELTKCGITVDPTWGKAHLKKVLDDSRPSR